MVSSTWEVRERLQGLLILRATKTEGTESGVVTPGAIRLAEVSPYDLSRTNLDGALQGPAADFAACAAQHPRRIGGSGVRQRQEVSVQRPEIVMLGDKAIIAARRIVVARVCFERRHQVRKQLPIHRGRHHHQLARVSPNCECQRVRLCACDDRGPNPLVMMVPEARGPSRARSAARRSAMALARHP